MLRQSICQLLGRSNLCERSAVSSIRLLQLTAVPMQCRLPAIDAGRLAHFSTNQCSRFAAQPAAAAVVTSALPADAAPHSNTGNGNDGLLRKLMKKIGWSDNSRSRLRVSSYLLYQSVADNINYKEFFDTYRLPNTFNSWFLVTELHVWMLLMRAMAEGAESGEDGRFMRNCIVEAMWADVNSRAKKLGSANPGGVRNQIQVLSQQFQAALITYDEGASGDDMVLAGALWRRFFAMDCDDFEQLERMCEYVRFQVSHLDSLSRQEFAVKPNIVWTKPDNTK